MMARLQLSVALLALLCFNAEALDLESQAQIRKEVTALQKENQVTAKRYWSTRDLSSRVLDKGLALVEQMEVMVEEYGLEGEFPSVAKFVENLKNFLKDTKDFANQHINALADEFEAKEQEIKAVLLKLLEN